MFSLSPWRSEVKCTILRTRRDFHLINTFTHALPMGCFAFLQLPTVLREWLEPVHDGQAFLPSPQRASLFKVLMMLPVQKSHLRESGIGKLVVTMAADPRETRDNRELIKQARAQQSRHCCTKRLLRLLQKRRQKRSMCCTRYDVSVRLAAVGLVQFCSALLCPAKELSILSTSSNLVRKEINSLACGLMAALPHICRIRVDAGG